MHGLSYAEAQQQAAVVLWCGAMLLQHLRIAGGLAMKRVLAHRPRHQRMEKEQPLRNRRRPTKPEVAATQMGQLVGERHR